MEIPAKIKLIEWLNWAEKTNASNYPIDSLAFLSTFEEQKMCFIGRIIKQGIYFFKCHF